MGIRGRVENIEIQEIGRAYLTRDNDIMRLEIKKDYSEGLHGIEKLKQIYVIYWMHQLSNKDRKRPKVHPRGDKKRALRGVFALRSPMRPNPIGLTKVELIKRQGDNLYVKGLDALDGSPIIDIKKQY